MQQLILPGCFFVFNIVDPKETCPRAAEECCHPVEVHLLAVARPVRIADIDVVQEVVVTLNAIELYADEGSCSSTGQQNGIGFVIGAVIRNDVSSVKIDRG